jgi:predicted DNA-binding transcriptional regulator YafY
LEKQFLRKASRLFEIIQILRLAARPVTAAQIAAKLEVTPRSIYRDIVALQAMRVPIEGGRGIGYVLRSGFDLPPLMFTIEETEAIVLALALLKRTGDLALRKAADGVTDKIAAALPAPLRPTLSANTLYAWGMVQPPPGGTDFALLRQAIRDERKLALHYRDEGGSRTERIIRPIALIYYASTAVLVGWCELRQGFRNFRTDRIEASSTVEDAFIGQGDRLRNQWIAGWNHAHEKAPPGESRTGP